MAVKETKKAKTKETDPKKKTTKEVCSIATLATNSKDFEGQTIHITLDGDKVKTVSKFKLYVIKDPVTKLPARVVYGELDKDGKPTGRKLALSKLVFGTKHIVGAQYTISHINKNVLDFRLSNLEVRVFGIKVD